MKSIIIALFHIGLMLARAEDAEFLHALNAYRDVSITAESPDNYLNMSDDLIDKWSKLEEADKVRWAEKIALVHFRKAQVFANSKMYEKAAQELLNELDLQAVFGGKLEYATKTSDSFFVDLVELQAQVTAETGNDPLASKVDYYFKKDGDGFVAARLELGDDIAGITVPNLGRDEALAVVHRLIRKDGKFVVSATKWLVAPNDELPDMMNEATREVTFDTNGMMVVRRVEVAPPLPKAGEESKGTTGPSDVAEEESSARLATDRKEIEVDPTRSDEKIPMSTKLIAVSVLIAMSIGLLMLTKRRN